MEINKKVGSKDATFLKFKDYLSRPSKNVRYDEIPEFLLCRITDELMNEPVILSSGFTYEKTAILKHFEVNGAFDPMTREQVSFNNLVVNRHIK
jgi:hypothetical protein